MPLKNGRTVKEKFMEKLAITKKLQTGLVVFNNGLSSKPKDELAEELFSQLETYGELRLHEAFQHCKWKIENDHEGITIEELKEKEELTYKIVIKVLNDFAAYCLSKCIIYTFANGARLWTDLQRAGRLVKIINLNGPIKDIEYRRDSKEHPIFELYDKYITVGYNY